MSTNARTTARRGVCLADPGTSLLVGELDDDGVCGAVTVVRAPCRLERDDLDVRDRRDAHDSAVNHDRRAEVTAAHQSVRHST